MHKKHKKNRQGYNNINSRFLEAYKIQDFGDNSYPRWRNKISKRNIIWMFRYINFISWRVIALKRSIFFNFRKFWKKEEANERRKKIYKSIKKIIKDEINQIQNEEEEEEETENSNDDDAQESTENDEERIKRILKGDENAIQVNLKSQLNLLLKKLKINQFELEKEFEEVKKVDGNFLYNSWVSSFEKEDFKKNNIFLKYVKIDKRASLSNMGFFVNEILDGFCINFNEKDPNQIEKKIKKKKYRKKVKKAKRFQNSA